MSQDLPWDMWDPIITRAVSKVEPEFRKNGNRHHDDLVQEAKVGVWKATLSLGNDLYEGQVYKAAYWAALGELRRIYGFRKKERPSLPLSTEQLIEDGLEPEDPEDFTVCVIRRAELESVLSGLEEHERAFVLGWLLEGLPAKEAAARTGQSYSRLQTRWSRYLRDHLRSSLKHL